MFVFVLNLEDASEKYEPQHVQQKKKTKYTSEETKLGK